MTKYRRSAGNTNSILPHLFFHRTPQSPTTATEPETLESNLVIQFEKPSTTTTPDARKTVVLTIRDFVTEAVLAGAEVYIDNSLKGTSDVNGQVTVTGVETGSHTLRVVKSGYVDSDQDDIANSTFEVT